MYIVHFLNSIPLKKLCQLNQLNKRNNANILDLVKKFNLFKKSI